MNQSKILITGSNGFLGQELRKLLDKNFNIIATGLGPDRLCNHNHIYVELNIQSAVECDAILNKYHPAIIINAAALTDVDQCEQDKSKCFAINSDSIRFFKDYVQKRDIHFIQISTDFIFDGNRGWYAENYQYNPLNIYGLSKLRAEKIITQNFPTYTILRTSLVYGLGPNNFLGWVRKKIMQDKYLNIVGDQYRTPTYVFDLAYAVLQVMNLKKYGVYHISGGQNLSIFDFVCNIAKHVKVDVSKINKISSKELNQIAVRPVDTSLSIDKAMRDFDFNPTKLDNVLNQIL